LIERVVVVGRGNAGSRHFKLIKELLPNVEVKYLIHSKGEGNVNSTIEELTSIQEVLTFRPQIAIVATPSTTHIEIAQKLAEAGIHILIEKPISASLSGVADLISYCSDRNLVLQVGYNLRYSDSLKFFNQCLNSEEIGEILSVRCEVGQNLESWRPNKNYRESVSAKKSLGGGVLLELSHELDYLRWIFGEVDWVRATLCKLSELDVDVEDTAHINLGFTKSNFKQKIIANLSLDFVRQDHTRTCLAIGTTSSLRWDGIMDRVEIYDNSKSVWRELYSKKAGKDETYRSELQDFLSSVENGNDPQVTGEDGLRVLEIIEAVRQSSGTGTQVYVTTNPFLERSLP